ncbi:hypothetical protein GQ53DRAFT_746570 [Thozetella sp. PMI_491]|nr:hypothetical protein GQ53DRAFT_746570 [Thozetella sp. PMI_491]
MVRIGTAYLAVNITEVGSRDSEVALSPLGYTERGEWLDLVFSNRAVISISLCYSAFSQADIPVHISSNVNRTETIPTFNFATQKYEFHDLRHQMGQPPEGDGDRNSSTPLSPQDRGLLDMHNQSWIATLRDVGIYNNTQMYFRAAVGFDGWNEGNSGNISALLHTRWDVVHAMTLNESNSLILPDTMHIWLVQEIMLSGGSVAFALQTMLTLLSSMAYYDTAAQFDAVAPADVSFFVVASVPLSWRGFIVVAVTMAAHLAITIALLIKFLWDTQFSRVGATWSALAQGSYGETEAWLAGAELASDQGVESSMETEGVTSVVVGLAAENGRVGIVKKVDKQDKGVTIAA